MQTTKTDYVRDYVSRCARLNLPIREDKLKSETGWADVERTLRKVARAQGHRLRKESGDGGTRYRFH